MTPEERVIYVDLKRTPGECFITPDGTQLYLLVTGGMMCLTGPDFKTMTEIEINEFIQEFFKK